jgi:hypothetical protein
VPGYTERPLHPSKHCTGTGIISVQNCTQLYHPGDTHPCVHLSQCQGTQRGHFTHQTLYRYRHNQCTELYPTVRDIILGIRSLVFTSVSARVHREATSPIKTLYRYRHHQCIELFCKGHHPGDTGPNIHLKSVPGCTERLLLQSKHCTLVLASYVKTMYRYQQCTFLYPTVRGIILGIQGLIFTSVSARVHREATSPIKTLYRYRQHILK